MQAVKHEGRTLTQLDFSRLCKLNRGTLPDILDDTVPLADLVDSRQVAGDVVTMNSQVEVRLASGERSRFTLVYPADAEPAMGRVSVLSPLGASLLGLRVGDTARWTTPTGGNQTAQVLAVPFQPEASGDYTT